jgi:phosphate transport system substrate-binding protein
MRTPRSLLARSLPWIAAGALASACGGGDRPAASADSAAAGGGATPGGTGATLTGAGATFPNPIYTKWFDTYAKATGVRINYQSIGSGGGIRQFT